METGSKGGGYIVAVVAGIFNFVVAIALLAAAYSYDPGEFAIYMPGILWGVVSLLLMQGSRIAAYILMVSMIIMLLLFMYVGLQSLAWQNSWFYILIGMMLFMIVIGRVTINALKPSRPW